MFSCATPSNVPVQRGQVKGRCRPGAFTLIELMIVVGIMGIMMTMGVPLVYRTIHREAFQQAVRDVQEVCGNARARAIIRGTMAEVVFHPKDGRLEVVCSGTGTAAGTAVGAGAGKVETVGMPGGQGSAVAARISDRVSIEMLDINLVEYKSAEEARVRFYPNGMCDELTLVLRSEDNRWVKLTTELTTGLTTIGPLEK